MAAYQVSYTIRDKLGRIKEKQEILNGVTKKYEYRYHSLSNRLEEVYQDDVRVSRYEYDENGNRLRKITPNGTLNGIYDDQDRLLSYGNTTYGYTNHGDLEEKIDAIGKKVN